MLIDQIKHKDINNYDKSFFIGVLVFLIIGAIVSIAKMEFLIDECILLFLVFQGSGNYLSRLVFGKETTILKVFFLGIVLSLIVPISILVAVNQYVFDGIFRYHFLWLYYGIFTILAYFVSKAYPSLSSSKK